MRRKMGLSCFVLLLSSAVFAQTTFVVPPGYANKEGKSISGTPPKDYGYHWMVGRYTHGRAQQVIPRKFLPTNPFLIRKFKMRRDSSRMQVTFAPHKIDMEVFMSNNPKTQPPEGYSMVFESNHGADKTLVMKKKAIDWPGLSMPTNPPAPFNIVFVLDRPFVYKPNNSLILDWVYTKNKLYQNDYYLWYTDAIYHGWYNNGPTTNSPVTMGQGCPTNYRNYGFFPYRGGKLWLYGYSRVKNKKLPGVMMIGSNDKKWGNLTLPLDLTPFGAPGCKLYIDIIQTAISFTDPASSSGYILYRMGCVPNLPILDGMSFYCQQLVLDPSYNAFGVRMSPYRKYIIGQGFRGKTDTGFCFYGYWRYQDLPLPRRPVPRILVEPQDKHHRIFFHVT